MDTHVIEPGTEYTTPENRGVCSFCGREENGYAKKDAKGNWQPACWPCVKPESSGAAQPKRNPVGSVFTEPDKDLDTSKESAPVDSAPRVHREIDPAVAVAMYQAGKKVSEIAQHFGYGPDQGQNRTREILKTAGVYKKCLQ